MITVYASGVFDLFHYGHVRLLKSAKSFGDYLLVGIPSDETVLKYRERYPMMGFKERMEVVSAIYCVDETMEHPPDPEIDEAFYKKHKIDVHVQGDHPEWYQCAINLGIFQLVPYTEEISTTEVLKRMRNRLRQENS